ncbi:MAG: hypothetical protein GY809_33065 [Planctomycetes bacterium]|nr:hypothetical protein [Planctomycetota bacterium]
MVLAVMINVDWAGTEQFCMALALEISEDLPANWQETIPVVLDTLKDAG